jgi:hypothetical protein
MKRPALGALSCPAHEDVSERESREDEGSRGQDKEFGLSWAVDVRDDARF